MAGSCWVLGLSECETSNVHAWELAIPLDLEGARELLLEGRARPVRLLLANERPFLLWAGTGLDARIMGNTSPALKRWLGRTGIFFTVFYEVFRYEFPRLELTVDSVTPPATFAVICHARDYAGGWVIPPHAP